MDYLSNRGVVISVSTAIAQEAKKRFTVAEWAQDIPAHLLLRSGDEISIYFNQLDEEAKDWLHERLTATGNKSMAGTISALRRAEEDPANSVGFDLVVFAKVLSEYIKKNSIDGWVYAVGDYGERLPWLVTNVMFHEASNAPPSVAMYLVSNSAVISREENSRPANRVIYFFADEIRNRRVAEVMATKGFTKETPELKRDYSASLDAFMRFQPQLNHQFIATRGGYEVDLENHYKSPERTYFDAPAKVINDEGLIRRKFFVKFDSPFWGLQGKNFSDIPMHPKIFCFNLETHTNMWIHADNLSAYEYDLSLKSKLVLPPQHRDLIDILTQDMDVLMDDIVIGKSGGTTILCKGAPGLGKTLTAEVYSEVVQRPLYRIHSGQLGVVSEDVEKNLDKILKRAQRWGAVMLIDEADVYIRQRGNDIDHNAVVASFLRTLEYFHGLLFLTTNRVDDVDDAIASRCIATIRYEPPEKEDAKKIWMVIAEQFQFNLPEPLIDELVDYFVRISGRDVKELLKLTAKWCRQKDVPPSLEVFRSCAQFRGL